VHNVVAVLLRTAECADSTRLAGDGRFQQPPPTDRRRMRWMRRQPQQQQQHGQTVSRAVNAWTKDNIGCGHCRRHSVPDDRSGGNIMNSCNGLMPPSADTSNAHVLRTRQGPRPSRWCAQCGRRTPVIGRCTVVINLQFVFAGPRPAECGFGRRSPELRPSVCLSVHRTMLTRETAHAAFLSRSRLRSLVGDDRMFMEASPLHYAE
jgi:hypothetical protein